MAFHGPDGAGKGDQPRPQSNKWDSNYDSIFGTRCRLAHKHTSECDGYTQLSDGRVVEEGKERVEDKSTHPGGSKQEEV